MPSLELWKKGLLIILEKNKILLHEDIQYLSSGPNVGKEAQIHVLIVFYGE